MGRLTEYYKFLTVSPNQLVDFYKTLGHITVTDKDKDQRRKLRLFNKKTFKS